MVCERCGHEIANNDQRPICPVCGTSLPERARIHLAASTLRPIQIQTGEYTALPQEFATTQATAEGRGESQSQQQSAGKTFYQQGAFSTPGIYISSLNSSSSAVLVEFALSLIGIFGIGWILAGETLIGIILLVGSLLLYWPVMFLGTLLTLGLGLICLGPFAVAAIICNAFFLNRFLKYRQKHGGTQTW
jgi:hypothetical protein